MRKRGIGAILLCSAPMIYAHYAYADPKIASQNAPTIKSDKKENIVVKGELSATGVEANYLNKTADIGPLGKVRLQDAPFSVMQVSKEVVQNQQIRNLNDEFKYLPSVQLEQRGDPGMARPQSRGYEGDVIANSRFDGLNGLITTPYAAEMFQKVSVLNGLAGALYGPQNPAGTFEYQLKRPTDQFLGNFNFGYDSNSAPLESGEISGRGFGDHAKWFGYRLNLLNQRGTSYVPGSRMRRDLISGDFDIHLDSKTVIELDASQYSTSYRGLPGQFSYTGGASDLVNAKGQSIGGLGGMPDAPYVAHDRAYGARNGGYNTSTSMGQWKIKREFNKNWRFRAGGMYEDAGRNVFTASNTFTDLQGDFKQSLSAASTAQDFRAWSNSAYLNGEFDTWKFKHRVNIGANGYWLGNYNPTYSESYKNDGTYMRNGLTHISDMGQPRKSGNYLSATTRQETLVAGDTVDITKHLSIMGEVSWAWLRVANYGRGKTVGSCEAGASAGCTGTRIGQPNVRTSLAKTDAAFAPMAAIVYKFTPAVSTYFNWGTSVQAGPLAPAGTSNQNSVQAPMRSEQYEVGAKWLIRDRLQLNVAAFRMSRPYYYLQNNGGYSTYTQGGNQRNQGVEFQASGKIFKDLSVLGGMTWLDSQVLKAGASNSFVRNAQGGLTPVSISHKAAVGVPTVQANILLDYRMHWVPGLGFNANVHYTGKRAADVYNASFVKGYVTLDLGTRYDFRVKDHDFVVRLNVNNVTGERYWASVFPSSIDGVGSGTDSVMAGLPRTWSMTASAFF